MKAERRHELKQNSLIWSLQQLPATIKQYQSQIALAVVVIALVIVLIRYKINSAQERLADAQASLAIAGDDLKRLSNLIPPPNGDLRAAMQEREILYSEGLKQADEVLEKAPESQEALRSQALLIKGDLNFEVANFPELPGASTEPSLRSAMSPTELLDNAQDAYTQVVQNFASRLNEVTRAHFGLAYVAENRASAPGGDPTQWDTAKSQFQAVADSSAPQGYKNLANQQIQLIPTLQRPLVTDLAPIPTSRPSTRPTTR